MRLLLLLALVLVCTGVGAAVEFGGHVELDLESEHNYDLDRSSSDTLTLLAPELQLELLFTPHEQVTAYLQTELKRQFELVEQGKDKDRDWRLELEEAWVELRGADQAPAARIGRQDFEDYREWLYDQELDGLRLVYGIDDFELELAAARDRTFHMDFLDERPESDFDLLQAVLLYTPRDDLQHGLYVIRQTGLNDNTADPLWVGLRSYGRLTPSLQHWLELALLRGDDDGQSLRGHAVDIGLTWLIDAEYRPYLTVGFAQGSGDDDPAEGSDQNFRQTGMQDNDDRFGGVTSFRYYGEVLDPELSNLRILTLGAGFRPSHKSSLDLVWHHYRQVEASDEMRDIALPDPNGQSRELGQSLDLILGYREIKNLKLELMLGWFFPGDAFAPLDDSAFFLGSEARFRF